MVAIKPWERDLAVAVKHARLLAQASSGCIELVSSVFDAGTAAGCERGEATARKTRDRTVAAARVQLERLAGSVRVWGVTVTTRIVWATPPYEAILGAAQESGADLLVVGAHEPGTLHSRLTDTDWQLMRRIRCPLLIVKSPWISGYQTVLAAVGPLAAGGPQGLDQAVLAAGRSFASAFGAALRAVYAYPGERAANDSAPARASDVATLHRRRIAELALPFGIEPAAIAAVAGSAAQALIEAATERRAELVVIGTAQSRGRAAAAHGNAAELVAGEASCDVLLVPPPAQPQHVAAPRSQVR